MIRSTGWGGVTALWVIVGIIAVVALLRWCDKQGDNKAELAAAIQRLAGRQEVYGVQIEKNTTNIQQLNATATGAVVGLQNLREISLYNFGRYDHDLYKPCAATQSNGGCSDNRFVKRDFFTPAGSLVTNVQTCG